MQFIPRRISRHVLYRKAGSFIGLRRAWLTHSSDIVRLHSPSPLNTVTQLDTATRAQAKYATTVSDCQSYEEQAFGHLPRRLSAEKLLDDGHRELHGRPGAPARDHVPVDQHPVLALAGVRHRRVRRRLLALRSRTSSERRSCRSDDKTRSAIVRLALKSTCSLLI